MGCEEFMSWRGAGGGLRGEESEWKIEQGRGGTQGVLLGWSQRKQGRGFFSPSF